MMMLIIILFSISVAGALEIEGKAEPVLHEDLPNDLAFDICSKRGIQEPEYVRMVNKVHNTSFTVGLHNEGIEQLYNDIGFGLYPTNEMGVVTIHAWRGGSSSMDVRLVVDLLNETVLSTEVHNDVTEIMCYGQGGHHHITKRSVADIIRNALRRVCGHFLDFSYAGWRCGSSTRPVCSAIALALEVATVAVPGDSVIWYFVCRRAMSALCREIGNRDPTSLQVCAAIEQYLRERFGK